MKERINYPVYGTFKVTTEGDVEGRSICDLGTYTGYIDEIALKLADRCYYALRFRLTEPTSLDTKQYSRSKTIISLDIDSGTWGLTGDKLLEYFRNLFRDRPVYVSKTSTYAGVEIFAGTSEEARKEAAEKIEREVAKSKLTKRERELLGLD